MTKKLANSIESGALVLSIPLTLIAIGVAEGIAQYLISIFGVIFISAVFQSLKRLSKEAEEIPKTIKQSE